ncbi:Subtilisin-like protease SBT3.3 [Rhynchospora pubera]|uniref:Subtilisin-like protease SBT3.3 n=1 Tax=Rhynchospora pubera TaxID=906938 RepID=A0AAV8GA79_9POAL|nr:Subtilisin-like protease SBT3.3 [Rhynchospora pubera]
MRNILSSPLLHLLLLSLVLALMAEERSATSASEIEKKEEATVHIVYVDRPEGADPEEFHIRTLGSVLGSEEAAKGAVLYHYKSAASGFSAKLTPSQVEELKKQPGVLQIVPSQTYQLHGPGARPRGGAV